MDLDDVVVLVAKLPSAQRAGVQHAVLSGVALLAVTWVLALPDSISAAEESVFRAINGLPAWIEAPGWPLMQLGSLVAVPVIAIVCIAAFRDWRPPVRAAVAGGSAWVAAKIGKEVAGRGRPDDVLAELDLREVWEGLGFPSGHSAVAMAVAVVVASLLPRPWRPVAFGAAMITGLMRIYVGAHFPLDVIGGWGVGLAIGSLALLLPLGGERFDRVERVESGVSDAG